MKEEGGTILLDNETSVLGGEFKLTNPKRVHHLKYQDDEYLSL